MTKYRSNFEPGTTRWALRKAQWRALGIPEADMEKPKIASAGNGSSNHLTGEMFKSATGIDIIHVPYKGDGPAMTDLMG